MKLIGIILMVIGAAGAAANHFNVINPGGALSSVGTWGAVAAVGAVLFFLFRRPSD